MCSLTDSCFMCTSANICTIIDDKIVTQVEYVLPEITVVKMGIPLHICSNCVKDLQSFNKFKQVSVENCQRLEARIKQAQSNRVIDLQTSDTPDIQLCTNNVETIEENPKSGENDQIFEEIYIKEEVLDENIEDRDFYNSLVPNITMKECIEDDDTNCGYENTSAGCYVDDITKNTSDDNLNYSNDNETSDSDRNMLKPENSGSHSCPICNKKFTRKFSVVNHIKAHTGVKDYQCAICHKAFTRKDVLRIHIKTHVTDKSFKCHICNKLLSNNDCLRRHLKIHTGIKNFQCTICQKWFRRNSDLRIHITSHSGVKNFQCTVCNKFFAKSYTLKLHMRLHNKTQEQDLKK